MNGIDGMLAWAKTHKTVFYTSIYPRLIPVQVQGHIEATVTESNDASRQFLEHLLLRIIADQQRDSEEAGVVIDATADREPYPPLELSSKAGSKTA